jgi:hypothetical protein
MGRLNLLSECAAEKNPLPQTAAKIHRRLQASKDSSLVKSSRKMHMVSVVGHAIKMEIFVRTHLMIT